MSSLKKTDQTKANKFISDKTKLPGLLTSLTDFDKVWQFGKCIQSAMCAERLALYIVYNKHHLLTMSYLYDVSADH